MLPLKTPKLNQVIDSPDGNWQARITKQACIDPPVLNDFGAEVLTIQHIESGREQIAGNKCSPVKIITWAECTAIIGPTTAAIFTIQPDGTGPAGGMWILEPLALVF